MKNHIVQFISYVRDEYINKITKVVQWITPDPILEPIRKYLVYFHHRKATKPVHGLNWIDNRFWNGIQTKYYKTHKFSYVKLIRTPPNHPLKQLSILIW